MIAWLKGTCREVGDDHVVLDVHGVGYEVFLSERDLSTVRAGDTVEASIHMAVREDALQLFGFLTAAGRELFRALTSVSGVGPKGALALLSALEPGQLAAAIAGKDLRALTSAKGIGKRLAETIVVKLHDRVPAVALPHASARVTLPADSATHDVLSALVNLGYKPAQADAVLAEVRHQQPAATFQELLRLALAAMRRPTTEQGG